jgi:hypothetical protein
MPALMLLRLVLPTISLVSIAGSPPGADDRAALIRRYERNYTAAAAAHAAIPSFSRQTGLPCSSCHTTFPQLNAFGRAFKLNGYTLADSQVVSDGAPGKRQTLRLDVIPQLSAMIQSSLTLTQKAQPGAQNGSVDFPQQLSIFFGGAISPRLGTFVQVT